MATRKGWDFCVSRDDRGAGWSIFRFNESSGLDFRMAKDLPGITFVHKNGFLAKTKSILVDASTVINRCAGVASTRSLR